MRRQAVERNGGRLSTEAVRVGRGLRRRAQVAWASTGDTVACCYCGWQGRWFLPAGLHRTPNRKCPRCGSLERYRMLYLFLERRTGFFTEPCTVLEVGPKRCFSQLCRALPRVRYAGVGLDDAGCSARADITRLGVRPGSVDLVVCFHVLEHVANDGAALAELHRVLRPGGTALIQVPLRGMHTIEDPAASPAERERLFGQHDHVRWYGADVAERVRAAGFTVQLDRPCEWLGGDLVRRHALRGDDEVLIVATA